MGRTIFLQYDQQLLIRRFQLAADDCYIYLQYMNTPCRINRKNAQVDENMAGVWTECRSFNTVMTVYDLLCYPKTPHAPALSGSWCSVGSFNIAGIRHGNYCEKHARLYHNRTDALIAACHALGGTVIPSIAGASVSCQIPVTPFFPVLLQFWEGDEDFSPKMTLLWDSNALSFLHYETTFYLQGDLLNRLG